MPNPVYKPCLALPLRVLLSTYGFVCIHTYRLGMVFRIYYKDFFLRTQTRIISLQVLIGNTNIAFLHTHTPTAQLNMHNK